MYWSYVLAAVGLTGLWLAGSGKKIGWMVGAGAQILWFVYAITTEQYGFIATSVAYAIVYIRGAIKQKEKDDGLASRSNP